MRARIGCVVAVVGLVVSLATVAPAHASAPLVTRSSATASGLCINLLMMDLCL